MKHLAVRKFNLVYFWLLIISISSCADCLSGNDINEENLFKKIKIGMPKDSVVRILGKPDNIGYNLADSAYQYQYFTSSKSPMRSTMPTVCFDSSDTVTFSTYGN